MAKKLQISDFKHRMVVCSMDDRIDGEANEYRLTRKGIYSGWAYLEAKKASTFAREGVTIGESLDVPTHTIYMNYRTDIEISSAAWLYEERRKSAPRWFKITQVIEGDCYFEFRCRLVERSDTASMPQEPKGFQPVKQQGAGL